MIASIIYFALQDLAADADYVVISLSDDFQVEEAVNVIKARFVLTLSNILRYFQANAIFLDRQTLKKVSSDEKERKVLLLSTVMTWARTPIPEDNGALSEASFTSRKPSPKFSRHKMIEAQVLSLNRGSVAFVSFLLDFESFTYLNKLVFRSKFHAGSEGLVGVVIACGMVYGGREGVLHSIFRDAWSVFWIASRAR